MPRPVELPMPKARRRCGVEAHGALRALAGGGDVLDQIEGELADQVDVSISASKGRRNRPPAKVLTRSERPNLPLP